MLNRIKEKFSVNYNFFITTYRIGLFIFFRKILLSLAVITLGIFLWPNEAYLSNITSENIIQLTNEVRLDANINTLSANQLLTKSAFDKAYAILDSQNFAHNINDKKFSVWIKNNNYNYSYVGENLAIDFATNEGVINAWLESQAHKKNLINPRYQEIGVAVVDGIFNGINTTVVVQIFGTPANLSIQPIMSSQPNWPNLIPSNLSTNYITNENLLTYTALEPKTLPNLNSKLLISSSAYGQDKVYNFFEQQKLFTIPLSFFLYFILISISFFYSYYCYVSLANIYVAINSKKLITKQ